MPSANSKLNGIYLFCCTRVDSLLIDLLYQHVADYILSTGYFKSNVK